VELGFVIAHDPNPLSTVCGRICGAPCETACRRQVIGPDFEPVAIRPIKRVLTERFGPEADENIEKDWEQPIAEVQNLIEKLPPLEPPPQRRILPGEGAEDVFSQVRWSRRSLLDLTAQRGRKVGKVAVVGAGPAGLTVAYDLALLGHQVTIYEAGAKTGGMMRYGVPVYRIDQVAMDREVQSILDLGVELRLNTPIGAEITLQDLRDSHDAVFLGIGLMQGRMLDLEGIHLDGVMTAVDLLLNYNMGYQVELGKHVLVVGGGDVAMDAARTALRLGQAQGDDTDSEIMRTALDVARTALRLGVADVRMIALESWEELPASRFELEEAMEEGIELIPRLGPKRILGENGQVRALEVVKVASVFDEQGRFNPEFIPNSEFNLECDTVILAIGQRANLDVLGGADDVEISPRGLVTINPETLQTTAADVFAGGDVAFGPRLIISAVRDGHVAAMGIEELIQGRRLKTITRTEWEDFPGHTMFPDWTKLDRKRVPNLPIDRRTGISVVETGYSLDQGALEGSRCLECSVQTIFDGSKCILCNGCVDVCPWDCLKIVRIDELEGDESLQVVLDAHRGSADSAEPLIAMLKDDESCTRCALCAKRCPTYAITMEGFRFQEALVYEAV
jgi:NADPH-dependent glutamate synthase beta subunit-like oxidoreductase/ferredoxin